MCEGVNQTVLSRVKSTQYSLQRGLNMLQNQSGWFWVEKCLLPLVKIKPAFLRFSIATV